MPPQVLRDYQRRGVDEAQAKWADGARSILFISPTGSGKTTAFVEIIRQAVAAGECALIVVHRRELATQACNRLREFGIDYGLIMAGEPARPWAPVQVATVQTLSLRLSLGDPWLASFLRRVRKAVADEAHLSTAHTWQTVLAACPNAQILGATATPWRLGGKPLIGAYDSSVLVATPEELRLLGMLSPYTGIGHHRPELKERLQGARATGDDYNTQDLGEIMSGAAVVGGMVDRWLEQAAGLSTVLFAATVERSLEAMAAFRARGIAAEHIDGKTHKTVRDAILARVDRGVTRVLCNVAIAVEGLDIPRLKCLVDAAPTKSLARAMQKWGRIRRPWFQCLRCAHEWAPPSRWTPADGCPRCRAAEVQQVKARIHCHAFNIGTHGLPDDERDYSLHAREVALPSLAQCPECFTYYRGRRCPDCAPKPEAAEVAPRAVSVIEDAEQFEFDSDAPAPTKKTPVTPVSWDSPGRVVEGIYRETWEETGPFGKQKRYLLAGDNREWILRGTTRLDALMSAVQIGALVRVTYTGEEDLSGGRRRKLFTVEVDDGTP